jgi:abortive infection bacteriophage resistance protein
MAVYPKPYQDIPSLLALLQQRGMQIPDAAKAARCLDRIGYYRLSGYWYPMRKSYTSPSGDTVIEQDFRPGSTFSDVAELYVFDKRLRLLLLDAIERVEIGLKVRIAQILGQRDPLAYLNANELHGNFSRKAKKGATDHELWIAVYRRNEKRSKEDFVDPFLKNHPGHEFPIWMAIEFWDFGNLSHFIPGMKIHDRTSLANSFGLSREELLTSWVRSIHSVRNTCAHHSRLWNRVLTEAPKPPRAGDHPSLDHLVGDVQARTRLYYVASALQFLLNQMHPGSEWSDRLQALIATFPASPNLAFHSGSGFPQNWRSLSLWT